MFIVATLQKTTVFNVQTRGAFFCCLVTVLYSTQAEGMTHMSAEINGVFNTLVRKGLGNSSRGMEEVEPVMQTSCTALRTVAQS